MLKETRNSQNTRWTDEEDERLITLIANDTSWRLIAAELKRSYQAVEHRASKLKRLASETPALIGAAKGGATSRPNVRDPESMNLACLTMSDAAMEVVSVLYHKAMAYRAATIARTNKYQKLKPRLQRVIGAIVRALLDERHRKESPGWVKVSMSRVRSSQFGINAEVFQNLLAALEHDGFLERLNGYAGAMELSSPQARRGRVTRVRGTTKLFDLCAHHQITADNAATHFKPDREEHSDNVPVL
jgi:23S rRNA pseudoU1915 N3-methylase RlmH